MKKIIIFLLYTLSLPLIAQDYLNFSSKWKESYYVVGAGTPYSSSSDYTIQLTGDTIINGNIYYKVLKSGTRITRNWVEDIIIDVEQINLFMPPLREENGLLIQYDSYLNIDQVLHNFNLSVGDTAVYTCQTPQIVVRIDTIFIGNTPRKKYHFSYYDGFGTSTLIEGVGCSKGLYVRPCSGSIEFHSSSNLECFSQDDQYYQIDTSIVCSTLVSVRDTGKSINSVKLFPNPFSDYININFNMNLSTEVLISISDLAGKTMWQRKIRNPDFTENLNLEGLAPGAYIISIHDKISKQSKIIIKTK